MALGIIQYLLGSGSFLKDPSQPFSITSKLLIVHGEAKSYCFTVSCVIKSILSVVSQCFPLL